MVAEPAAALARSTLGDYLALRRGEPVTVEAWSSSLGWARPFVVDARRLGARPLLALEDEDAFFRSLEDGGRVPTAPRALAQLGGAYVYLPGPQAFPRLLGLRPQELRSALERHDGPWRAAARRSGLRGARLAIATVSTLAAARYGVDLDGWRDEVVRASMVPSSTLGRTARPLVRRLARARRATIRHGNGTSLELDLRPHRWSEATGRPVRPGATLWTDLPTGCLRIAVRPGSADGAWEANRPAYDRWGDTAVGLGARFLFESGRLREVSFDRGGEIFGTARDARRTLRPTVVELSVGLNPQVSRAPEVGELEIGTLGLALAAGTAGSPGSRRWSFRSLLHGADVNLDGHPWLVGGRPARGP